MASGDVSRSGLGGRLRRLLLFRLVAPILRQRHSPEYTARGVLFGLLVALTPTVGIQMPIVFGLWLAVRFAKPDWGFNLPVALAWTWTTNVFTVPPVYYVFYVTGRLILGGWDDLTGYDAFAGQLGALLASDGGWLEKLWVDVVRLFEAWGLPMLVGSVPWALLGAWLGYRWSLGLIRRFHAARRRRVLLRRRPRASVS